MLFRSSGHFLTAQIPDNWEELDEEKQDEFLEDAAWQPFENERVSVVWSIIEDAAEATIRHINKHNLMK